VSLYREIAQPLEMVDRNTLEGQLVPWGVTATVTDLAPDGRFERYKERFERGAFDPQLTAGDEGVIRKVELRDQHEGGLGKMGWALALEDRPDGFWGRFRVREANVRDVAQMYEDGINGLSMSFHPLPRGGTRIDGPDGPEQIRTRVRAYLEHAALVATPAYPTARVLALRDQPGIESIEAADEVDAAEAAERRRADYEAMTAWLADSDERRLRWAPASATLDA
jgi:phage head maturation protease